MIRTIITTAAFSCAVLAGGVHAQDRVAQERNVSVRDIDFSKPEKVRELYSRIQAAASAVCHSDFNDPATANDDRACEAQSVRETVARIDQPQLTRLAERDDRSRTELASRDDRRGTR